MLDRQAKADVSIASLFVRGCREWDTWRNPGKVHQVFLTLLDIPHAASSANRSVRPHQAYLAPFNGTSTWSLMQPFESGQFDISIPAHGKDEEPTVDVIINVKDKSLNYAFHTRRQIYLTSVGLEWKTVSLSGSYPYEGYQFVIRDSANIKDEVLITSGDQAAVSESKFSPDGRKIAWLEMLEDTNESDRNRVVVYDLKKREKAVWTETWDRSPSSVNVSPVHFVRKGLLHNLTYNNSVAVGPGRSIFVRDC